MNENEKNIINNMSQTENSLNDSSAEKETAGHTDNVSVTQQQDNGSGNDKIVLKNVHKSFTDKKVLTGVDLTIRKGETMVIIGGSGSGKSVTLRHMIGLIDPDKGDVYVDSLCVNKLSEDEHHNIQRKFGMLFQSAALFDSLNVLENVGFMLYRFTDKSDEEIREIVNEKLALVGLKDVETKKPAELSGGMKKRVGLARAIAMSPEMVLYDEPTTGLDPITADMINNLIIDLRDKLNITSVVVTHDMVSARKVGDRLAMLYQGKIIKTGNIEEIDHSDDPRIQQFVKGLAEGPIKIM